MIRSFLHIGGEHHGKYMHLPGVEVKDNFPPLDVPPYLRKDITMEHGIEFVYIHKEVLESGVLM
jgi:hypothetical protein